jgi:ABC-type phosphate transport system ATPase subunit
MRLLRGSERLDIPPRDARPGRPASACLQPPLTPARVREGASTHDLLVLSSLVRSGRRAGVGADDRVQAKQRCLAGGRASSRGSLGSRSRTRDHGPVLFELEDVTATRAGRVVLEGLRADLAEGATGIVGPSGVGKSTLLRLLNRLADPAFGRIRYRGRDLREGDVCARRRDVGLVPQLPALLDGTVADNVLYGPRLAKRDADVGESLRLAGLDPAFASRRADALSVGEQQRVMFARTLALQPSVLLLDEPTSALDDATTAAIEATLQDLRERLELSLVLVTHDLDQAARLSDRVLVLEPGALREAPAAAARDR